jgi:predicted ATPase/class 3 adenylate cyclase/tetratricopeptide (TPR) repeat protein
VLSAQNSFRTLPSPRLTIARFGALRKDGHMVEQPTGTVTLVFTDIEGSTQLLHELGQESYLKALTEHRRIVREVFGRRRGYEVDYEGDAFFYAFASAREAVEAVSEAQTALGAGPIRIRVGLHTGEPMLDPPKYVGTDVHLAARIMSAGHGGQVLLSEATRELAQADVRELGRHRLKDFDESVALYQLGRDAFPPLKTISNTNLPRPVSSFVGRGREVDELVAIVRAGARMVTLSGPGGTGKTRLANEAAGELVGDFAAGVFWIGLATVRDASLVTETIAHTLGAKDDLAEHIGTRQLLLVLDNFEQVVEAAPDLSTLLADCPSLQLVVTSRELLRVQGERDYAVPPLAEPEAIELFCVRAQVEPDSTIAELCARLDNLPLAVELAAARLRVLSPAQLLERLKQRLDLLKAGRDADPRQRTLRATIAWSHDLLTDDEQELFARLSVFTGGCTLDAAEEVADADLDTLESLVDKSLVRHTDERFWMLETMREYAAERLAASSDEETGRRHADFFLTLAEDVELQSRAGDQAALFKLLDADNANLRQAVESTRENSETELELRLVTALWGYWLGRGYVAEGRRWLENALAQADDPPPRALLGLCMLRHLHGDAVEEVLADARRALHDCEELGDDFGCAQAWNVIGRLEGSGLGRMTAGEDAWRRALAYAERGNYAAEKAESMGWLMVMAVFASLPTDEGIERCKEFFAKAGEDEKVRAFAQVERAVLEAMRGNLGEARALLAEGHRRFENLGLRVWAANNAQEAFYVEMLADNPAGAAATLGASYDELTEMGERGFLSTIAGMLAHALHALGEDDEAEQFSRESERLAAPDDAFSQWLWRSALAKVLARRGEYTRAVELAREALELLVPDMLTARGDAAFDLAVVLAAAGRVEEARAAARQAAEQYEQKGNLVALGKARAFSATLSLTPNRA